MGLGFRATNENLDAIMAGLAPSSSDNILAICGSGDQAFALLEDAAWVHAVDSSETAIRYAQQRQRSLREDNPGGFFIGVVEPDSGAVAEHTLSYFSREGRLAVLAQKAERISFEVSDIFDCIFWRFNKIYLSNVFNWLSSEGGGQSSFAHYLQQLIHWTSPGAVIYVADETPALQQFAFPPFFQKQTELTERARVYGTGLNVWAPIVYEKR